MKSAAPIRLLRALSQGSGSPDPVFAQLATLRGGAVESAGTPAGVPQRTHHVEGRNEIAAPIRLLRAPSQRSACVLCSLAAGTPAKVVERTCSVEGRTE